MIPYSRQYINKKDVDSVKKVLKSDFLTQGDVLKKFENRVSKTVNSKYSIAISNATAGLHLSCLSLDLSPGDFLGLFPILLLQVQIVAYIVGQMLILLT